MITVEPGSGFETWSMGAPPVNAIGPEMVARLRAEVDRITRDEAACAVVLTSSLAVFSAGADAKWVAQTVKEAGREGLVDVFQRTMDGFRDVCGAMRRSRVLFIAALNGHTLAGGLELAAACDLRFAADSDAIRIGVPEMKMFGALPSGAGGTQYLARLMGPSRALEFILRGEPCTPREAFARGLVDRLVPADQLRADAAAFAGTVAAQAGPIGVAAAKRAILGASELSLHDALELDYAVHWDTMRRGKFRDGAEAFAAKYGG